MAAPRSKEGLGRGAVYSNIQPGNALRSNTRHAAKEDVIRALTARSLKILSHCQQIVCDNFPARFRQVYLGATAPMYGLDFLEFTAGADRCGLVAPGARNSGFAGSVDKNCRSFAPQRPPA